MKLRDYQEECLDSIREGLNHSTRLLVVAPCGFGKTIVFCHIAHKVSIVGMKTLIIVDNVSLALQTKKRLLNFTNEIGLCCGSLGLKETDKLITIGTIQTLEKMPLDVDYVIQDEAHESRKRYESFLEGFAGKVLGFTATPYSAKGRAIYGKDQFFEKVTYRCTPEELIERNYLVPMTYKAAKEKILGIQDLSVTSLGDYHQGELKKLVTEDINKINEQIKDMLSYIKDRKKVVIMTTGIEHANLIGGILTLMNLSNVVEHSKIESTKRREQLEHFEGSDCRFLVGLNAIYKGLDIKQIDCLVNMRPTKSLPFYVQFIGRGSRPFEGKKDCLFLDYGDVVIDLGFYETIKEHHKNKRGRVDVDLKTCPECDKIHHQLMAKCSCGFVFYTAESSIQKLRDTLEIDSPDYEASFISVTFNEEKNLVTASFGGNPKEIEGRVFFPMDHMFGRINYGKFSHFIFGKYYSPKTAFNGVFRKYLEKPIKTKRTKKGFYEFRL